MQFKEVLSRPEMLKINGKANSVAQSLNEQTKHMNDAKIIRIIGKLQDWVNLDEDEVFERVGGISEIISGLVDSEDIKPHVANEMQELEKLTNDNLQHLFVSSAPEPHEPNPSDLEK